jgi:hypothetical protein
MRPLRLRVSSDDAVIQVSTSVGVVRITGVALEWIAPTSEFGSVVRNVKRSLVVSPSFTFRAGVQLVQMPAMQARGRLSSVANQISPPSALLNSLNEVNVITQQLPTPSGGGTRCGRSANEIASRSKRGTTTSGRRAKRTYAHSTSPKSAYKWLPDFANAIAVPETEP